MKQFLENKGIKVFCIYINPLIIGAIFSAMGNWDIEKDKWFWIKITFLVLLGIIYTYTSYKYSQIEKNNKEEIVELKNTISGLEQDIENKKHRVESYNKGVRELTTLFYDSSNSVNLIANKILSGNKKMDEWNFKKVATSICSSVYSVLCEICSPCNDFTVNIMLADITAAGKKKSITMIAHKGKYEKYPGKFEEKLYFAKYPSFYAVKLFKSGKTDIKVLTSKEEVNEHFVYIDEEHPEYSQYVGIPIVCSGNKMICLLQICAFGEEKIANTKSDILKIVQEYIIPFTQFALLAYKMEKTLVTSLSMLEKMEEKQNGKD